jgi:YHS domain-containing protein
VARNEQEGCIMRLTRNGLLILAVLGWLAGASVQAAEPELALQGHDAVAYFTLGKPTPGTPQFQTNYLGKRWQFKNQAHRDLFVAQPEKYAPQYGGYCAYAAANNALASGDPQRWRIVDDKLYLNNNWVAQKLWLRDVPGHITVADRNWPSLNPAAPVAEP